tara:strand:+ start:10371 stop:10766 length:396 start_codon:yes stop_codon:yes gene_type:complete
MIKDDNFEKIKEKFLSTQKPTNDESVFITLNLSFENKHSVSDLNAKSWFDNVIKEAKSNNAFTKESAYHVYAGTELMFSYIRSGVKNGIIKEAYLKFNDNTYDCILPSGKIMGQLPKEIFNQTDKITMALL